MSDIIIVAGERPNRGLLPYGCLLLGLAILAATPTASLASVGQNARSEFICMRDREVFRPEGTRSLDEAARPGGVKLVKVTICQAGRRACFAMGDEVPFARCGGAASRPE